MRTNAEQQPRHFERCCFAAVASVAAISLPALADVIHVPDDYATIQQALNSAAQTGDEIVVAPGTYNEALYVNRKDVYLHSSDGRDVTTIDATGLERSAISCVRQETADMIMEGFTITGGGNIAYGGGLLVRNKSHPTVRSCVFVANSAEYGGAIYTYFDSYPNISDCVFEKNRALYGGAVYNDAGASPTFERCEFTDNIAAQEGGGMYNDNECNPILNACFFTDNSADYGGGMSNLVASPELTDCEFFGNSARINGGGMRNYANSHQVLTRRIFRGNTARSNGGAISNEYHTSPQFIDCEFRLNKAGALGGAVYQITDATARWFRCVFIRNKAGASGGAVSNGENCHTVFAECHFLQNLAGGGGGGIISDSTEERGSLILTQCRLSGNEASRGGALLIENLYTVDVTDTLVCGNMPEQIDGNWLDSGGNCVTDTCDQCYTAQLNVTPTPLVAGESAEFEFANGFPHEPVFLVYSLDGPGSQYLPSVQISVDLRQPRNVGRQGLTDRSGLAIYNLHIPKGAAGLDIWFQAAQFHLKTNVIATSIVD